MEACMTEREHSVVASGRHGHHAHGPHEGGDERRVRLALLLTGGFMLAEVAGGIWAGSLALIADAGHMLTDTAALALSWYASRISRRPATPERSYGHHRAQVLAALTNGGALAGIAAWITVEAVDRLFTPQPVLGGPMLAIAVLGLIVNLLALRILGHGGSGSLNVRGAALHVMGDLLGSAAAILAAGIILLTGWTPIDPILSVLVALVVLHGAWRLAGQSWHVLMEGTPAGLDVPALRRELAAAVPGVRDVHHVHAWSLTPERPLLTLHARIAADADHDEVLHRLQDLLAERFGIAHATIQVERDACADDRARDVKGNPSGRHGGGT